MTTVKYIWGTPYGTDTVPCKVIDKNNGRYRIEFFDDISNEVSDRWVKRSDLEFPKYSDMIYC